MTETTKDLRCDERSSGRPIALLTAGGVAAAFGLASCCGLPFLLATAGLSTTWLTDVALFSAPHRAILLVVAPLCLVGGSVLLWRQQRRAACLPGTLCVRPAVRAVTLIGLLLGFALLYVGYTYA